MEGGLVFYARRARTHGCATLNFHRTSWLRSNGIGSVTSICRCNAGWKSSGLRRMMSPMKRSPN